MRLRVSRRQVLKCAVAGAIVPLPLGGAVTLECELLRETDYVPNPYGDPADWTPQQLARFAAGFELHSIQQRRPMDWRGVCYDGAIQWCEGDHPLVIVFGVGPVRWTAAQVAKRANWLKRPLAAERVARGRAFAIVHSGRLEERTRYAIRMPAWQTSGHCIA